MNLWYVNEERFDASPKVMRSQESVFTIGNGYFCTRGTLEEGYSRANPATLLYGVFDNVPVAKEELANAPDWTLIGLSVNGDRFRLDKGTILEHHRKLDMQHGILHRTVRWQSPSGVRLRINSERIACLADEHVGAIRYSIEIEEGADNTEVDVVLSADLNTAVGNYDVMHWETIDQRHEQDVMWLHTETRQSKIQLAQTVSFDAHLAGCRKEYIDSLIAPGIRMYKKLAAGATLTVEKIVVMYTSRDVAYPVDTALKYHAQLLKIAPFVLANEKGAAGASNQVYDLLKDRHLQAWQHFWETADVIIEGDDEAQVGIRYSLYQLRINTSLHDSRYSVAAKGMTGFGYRGHIFHDTEIFMLPFYTYVMPDVARNLLLYRYRLLPAARKRAASYGYEGAQYPWESTLDGTETTPGAVIHPETGEVILIATGEIELHITSSIAHAVWEYWRVTRDDEFMREYGVEILLSTTMFWASRVEKNDAHGDYEISNVIGPDEWHERVNNNIYTNYMARKNIQLALECLGWLKGVQPARAKELESRLDITSQRLEHWQEVVKRLRICQDKQTGVFEQFDGFFELETLELAQFEGRQDSYQGIIGIQEVQQYRIIKQADVLMLLTVLDREFDLQIKRANWDYYYPITDHDYGSSLTPALHTILACELGLANDAYKQFMKGALVDLKNLRGNTPEGVHLACAGAVWQAAVLGFAGLRVDGDGYAATAHLPDGWKKLAFTFRHRGELVHIELNNSNHDGVVERVNEEAIAEVTSTTARQQQPIFEQAAEK